MTTEENKGSIRNRLLTGVLVIEVVITVLFATILVVSFRLNLKADAQKAVERTRGVFDIILKNDTNMLSAAIDSFATNDAVKQIYRDRDREKLFGAVYELYKSNKEHHGITQFQFIDRDGTCFLLVHRKEQFGYTITRPTFVQARASMSSSSGIELGKTTFALRVVSPYMLSGNVLGFVEFGEGIEHFNALVKGETGVDVAVLLDKKQLKEADYRATRKDAGQPDDWDDLKGAVLVSTTLADRKFVADQISEAEVLGVSGPVFLGTTRISGRTFAKGAFPLKDSTGKQLGAVVAFSDLTEQTGNERTALISLLVTAFLVFGISFYFAVRYLQAEVIDPLVDLSAQAIEISMGNVEKKLETDRDDEIGRLVRSFERMRLSLKKSLSMFAKK